MSDGHTTIAIQRYLGELARLDGEAPVEPIIRALLDTSVTRLQHLCRALLLRSYPRLTRPPLNLQTDEILSSVVDRLLKAMQEVRPKTVRQFFGLANRHMRWELNDLARKIDGQPQLLERPEECIAEPEPSGSQLSVNVRRILDAIETLPEDEREVFSLVRIQGMTHNEVAGVLGVAEKTVQRRLNRSQMMLAERLSDLNPAATPGAPDGVSEI